MTSTGERCRNCGDIFAYHKEYIPFIPGIRKWICTCKKFESLNNLKYLEYKYEQKGIS